MRAGKLRHRITIQREVTTRDGSGAPLGTWLDFAAGVPASIEPKQGHETPTGFARMLTGFRIRYLAGFVPSMRIVHDGKVFDVTSIEDVTALHREQLVIANELIGQAP